MEEKNKSLELLWSFGLLSFLVVLDQVTKYYARMILQADDIEIFSFLKVTLLYNRGLSFSMFTPTTKSGEYVLIIGIIVLLVMYVLHIANELKHNRSIVAEMMVMAGALGNVVDRIMFGGVVDFIMIFYYDYAFPVFNVADICIFVGFLLFVRKGFCNESC